MNLWNVTDSHGNIHTFKAKDYTELAFGQGDCVTFKVKFEDSDKKEVAVFLNPIAIVKNPLPNKELTATIATP